MTLDITPSRDAEVGGLPVRRALPRAARRTVGAWCFIDHFGPVDAKRSAAMQVGPHPHIGLQTVTWLFHGDVLHTDSIGSEQPIRPGQLNLMTAGRGVAHAESARADGAGCHGIQLWIAQPDSTRQGEPAFEHHDELPQLELGDSMARVLVGELGGVRSPARADTPLVGAELTLGAGGTTTVPLQAAWEHGLVVVEGRVQIDGEVLEPGSLAYLGAERSELPITGTDAARVMLVGGEPFPERVLMWWNFVARTRDEIEAARADWQGRGERFAAVPTDLPRIAPPGTPWTHPEPEPTIL